MGKPRQVFLRRASSTIYYALFHTLAADCANLLIGTKGVHTSRHAWLRVYRSIDHGLVKDRCKRQDLTSNFPADLVFFGTLLVDMQVRRHDADYNPQSVSFLKSEVRAELQIARRAIEDFGMVSKKDRKAFASYVLFRDRKP